VSEKTEQALELVRAERDRQDSLWGDQSGNHLFEWVSILGEEYGELCEAVNETCSGSVRHPDRGGPEAVIKEAVHVAAVAVEIIEAVTLQIGHEGTENGRFCKPSAPSAGAGAEEPKGSVGAVRPPARRDPKI